MEPGWSRTGMTPTNRNEILEGIMYTDIESQYGTGINSFRMNEIMYTDIESGMTPTDRNEILEGIMYTDIESQYGTGMKSYRQEWDPRRNQDIEILEGTGIMYTDMTPTDRNEILEGIMYTDIESQYGTGMNSFRNDSYRQESWF